MLANFDAKVHSIEQPYKRPIDPRSEQTKHEMNYLGGSFDQRGKSKKMHGGARGGNEFSSPGRTARKMCARDMYTSSI